ncbi:hypothetical protein GCM10025863_00530 [Microbacterium suwonense]|uniref:Uncharacterized protein n=1 Tax=Microbacterium suwonense TaxID=683047 RepID=A0ABN6WYB7_9MICO|nr:hypothetical protein GCM10025863_00530 [Microbacterium suwonense]
MKHVEVLVKIRQLALLILGDLDPYPPNITRRASPPPDVRRAAYHIEPMHLSDIRNCLRTIHVEEFTGDLLIKIGRISEAVELPCAMPSTDRMLASFAAPRISAAS